MSDDKQFHYSTLVARTAVRSSMYHFCGTPAVLDGWAEQMTIATGCADKNSKYRN